MAKRDPSDFNLLVFSRWYVHKGLGIVPMVAAELRKRDPARRYRFFLTFDTSSREWLGIRRQARRLFVEESVINLGPVLAGDGPGLYASCDALFLPTLLETFTATYPEAMCSRRPIVTTDLPFAQDVCGEAALYFPPNDAGCATERIARLAASDAVKDELLRKGEERLSSMITPGEEYDMLLEILEITARDRLTPAPEAAGRR
jgi:glycosyltransferase involved in cell wall biosynthesis